MYRRCIIKSNPDYIPYHKTGNGDIILYDFNMKVGDKYASVEGYDDVWVMAITDTITEGNISRKLFTLSNGLKIVEGVGCINSPGIFLAYLNYSFDYNAIGIVSMIECKRDDVVLYTRSWEDVEKEYTTGIQETTITTEPKDKRIFNLQGQLLQGEPMRGIYIRDGKKMIAR